MGQSDAPNAALLIDFDNVTMGMRSDLSKELKNLLNSDVIKGKVAVQRAYADWRRYPQYIVPLSEASIDLIFAPAYGSSKKNATDIRMAIDALELIFIRPEIGTFILLTGDSDFSSLVLKLKEYGKYVIGVGIQESSSDILVQNCDEYYSYTSLVGLRRTTESEIAPVDPWLLVERTIERMAERKDVMRSDRLKQVMLEIDPGFDEKGLGFSKFSRFLAEAASRKVVELRKLDNGQYEVARPGARRKEGGGRGKDRGSQKGKVAAVAGKKSPRGGGRGEKSTAARGGEARREAISLKDAYRLLHRALRGSDGGEAGPVRDSDVKRRMLEIDSSFDERELGFGKFSRFLRQAHDREVIDLTKGKNGSYDVALPGGTGAEAAASAETGTRPATLFDPSALGLPSGEETVIRYLTNSYRGVGKKTAEALVKSFGEDLFRVLHGDPKRVRETLPSKRADQVLEAWRNDYGRRREGPSKGGEASVPRTRSSPETPSSRTRSSPETPSSGSRPGPETASVPPSPTRLGRRRGSARR